MNDTILNNQTAGYSPILVTKNVRVFRPSEIRKLLSTISKTDQQVRFKALLFSGARYKEIKLLFDCPDCFNGQTIHLTKDIIKKKKIKVKDRHIRLNYLGRDAIASYLKLKKGLPSYGTWTENLTRWCKECDISPANVGPKSLRKTWESWLLTTFPDKTAYIMASQGHNLTTSLDHYLNIGFFDDDIKEMKEFMIGWI